MAKRELSKTTRRHNVLTTNEKSSEPHERMTSEVEYKNNPNARVTVKAVVDRDTDNSQETEISFADLEKKIFEGSGIKPDAGNARTSVLKHIKPHSRKGLSKSSSNVTKAKNISIKKTELQKDSTKTKVKSRDPTGKSSNPAVSESKYFKPKQSSNSNSHQSKISLKQSTTDVVCSKFSLSTSQLIPIETKTSHTKERSQTTLVDVVINSNSKSTVHTNCSKSTSTNRDLLNIKTNKQYTKSSSKYKDKKSKSGKSSEVTEVCSTSNKISKAVSKNCSKLKTARKPRRFSGHQNTQSSESELSDWEDVADNSSRLDILPVNDEAAALDMLTKRAADTVAAGAQGVQIELDAPTLWGAKRKKYHKTEEDWQLEYYRRVVNQKTRTDYSNCHKVHLLLLLGHGLHVNRECNSPELLAVALSIVTNKDVYPPKRIHLSYLEIFTRWFAEKISLVDEPLEKWYWVNPLQTTLQQRFQKKQAKTARELVLMFVILSRAVGMTVRLIQSMKPVHWKPTMDVLMRPIHTEDNHIFPSKELTKDKDLKKNKLYKKRSKSTESSTSDNSKHAHTSGSTNNSKKIKTLNSDSEYDSNFEMKTKPRKAMKSKSKSSKISNKNDVSREMGCKSKGSGKRSHSVDSNTSSSKKKRVETCAEWAEVYVEEEEHWVCVDVVKGMIHCAAELAKRAPAPVSYVTAYNPDQSVKDVTRRYVSKWLTLEDKLRCDSVWWGRVLAPYGPMFSSRDKAENTQLEEGLRLQPLPKTIAEYKNHPLYVLQRHLLKFEALYPPNPDPLGFFRSEAVYSRACVQTLHSRDIWLKEAKTVKVDEEPYKIVKARPRWDKTLCQMIKDLPLEVFGSWQMEDYKPPVAKDGKVPRNPYGNVELFKPTMMPIGCVHLSANFEDIGRVARKLAIDCAPAMVGFDFHRGGTHPVFDGYVVCQEMRDTLVDGWREEMELKVKREAAKRVRRIYDNWKRLIHGMLVRQHVREQYGGGSDQEEEQQPHKKSKGKSKTSAVVKATHDTKRKKVKQEDIDTVTSGTLKKEKVQLGIDFASDTVTMAKKFLKDTIVSRGMVHGDKSEDESDGFDGKIVPKKVDLILDSDDEAKETEEEKRQNLQNILAWNDSKIGSLQCLSDDDSDADQNAAEKTSIPPQDSLQSVAGHSFIKSPSINSNTRSRLKEVSRSDSSDSDTSDDETVDQFRANQKRIAEATTALSSSDEAGHEGVDTQHTRLCGSRAPERPVVSYKESGDSGLSDDSNFGDKTYMPD